MANIEPGLRCARSQRYSINQLLALRRREACVPFDLSKFSFDAARAGVVTSLGDCAVNSRRSSTTRARISSAESAASVASTIIPQASIPPMVDGQAPERRPEPPPFTMLAQQHTGFARFLKKHSSPTHQRVTAGGRIVPMEQQIAPPTFSLAQSGEHKPSYESRVTESKASATENQFPVHITGAQGMKDRLKSEDLTTPLGHNWRDINETALQMSKMNLSGTLPLYPSPVGFLPNQGYPDSNHVTSCLSPVPDVCSNMMADCEPQHGLWYNVCPAPLQSAQVYPMGGSWLYNDNITTLAAQQQMLTSSHLTQPIIWAHNALSDWTGRYNELDSQLKALDRHRAMTSLTADIASQRREIVQQRANSKNMINLISTWLGLIEQAQPDAGYDQFSSVFNATAPSYVPMAQQHPAGSSTKIYASHTINATDADAVKKTRTQSARRPIAIVPPPEATIPAQVVEAKHARPASPERDIVDQWGVKLGSAPPDLKKLQSGILETVGDVRSVSSKSNQSQSSLQIAPQGGFFQQKKMAASTLSLPNSSPDRGAVRQNASNDPLSPAKAMYEAGLDALRKPKGTTTRVTMPDGNQIEVEGQAMLRPDGANMAAFEEEYWSRKLTPKSNFVTNDCQLSGLTSERHGPTTPVTEMASIHKAGLSSTRRSDTEAGKENIAISPVAHRKAATDLFLTRFDRNDIYGDVHFRSCERRTNSDNIDQNHDTNQQHLRSLRAVRQHHPLTQHGSTNRAAVQSQKYHNLDGAAFYDTPSLPTEAHDMDEGNTSGKSTEVFNNKGYSSTLLQNVNVVAHVPQHLNGSADNNKGPKSIFSFMGKVKSPRFLRRTTGNGGAWYGPHCREVIEQALTLDGVESRQRSPKRASE